MAQESMVGKIVVSRFLRIDGYGDLDTEDILVKDLLFHIWLETKEIYLFPKYVELPHGMSYWEDDDFKEDYFEVNVLTLLLLWFFKKLEPYTLTMYFRHLVRTIKYGFFWGCNS